MHEALHIYLLTFLEYINRGEIVLPPIKDYSKLLLYLMTIYNIALVCLHQAYLLLI